MKKLLVMLVACGLGLPNSSEADVRLPKLVGDNMVLQRDTKLPLWGWADPGEKVTVYFQKQKKTAKAAKDGKWTLNLEPVAAGGPYDMRVEGKNKISIGNILVGDVWLASGQSNMEWKLKNTVNNFEKEIEAANYPNIRLFDVKNEVSFKPLAEIKSEGWQLCSPQTIGNFSAVAYFFGRDLIQKYNIPIGLIASEWGGTPAEAWTDAASLKQFPGYDKSVQENLNRTDKPERMQGLPATLYNAMIAPLVPYAIKGAIWYQGESNAGKAYQYRKLFPAMITGWRKQWGYDFPFLFVQLANYMKDKDEPTDYEWAELREAQTMTLALPKTGMAVAIDIGNPDDIHPRNKQDVGKRLALAAYKVAYNENSVYSGPTYQSMQVEGDKLRIKFANTGSGLVLKDNYGYVRGFAIAGADKKFKWAKGYQDGNDIIIYNETIKNPVAVRYNWSNNPDGNIYNKEGLPAVPFRTDEYPGLTASKE